MKRIALHLPTNIAVLVVLSVSMRLLGIGVCSMSSDRH